MRRLILLCLGLAAGTTLPAGAWAQHAEHGPRRGRLNPMITLLERGSPLFGLYAPSARTRGAPAGAADKSPQRRAEEALGFDRSDFVFEGSMESGVEAALPAFTAFVRAMRDAGATAHTHPLVVKMSEIAPDPTAARQWIGRQLDTGVSTVVFVGVESAEEVRTGLAAMRFRSHGGTRSDEVGSAPAYWGVTEQEYRRQADLWPLNPEGELLNWTIVESEEGLAHVREIAAVEGIGVLWPGAGTLRRVFSHNDASGARIVDEEAWEAAIQSVLAACKEFDVPCGYPATAEDIEMRMAQGFSVFVMRWGPDGFATVDLGRRAAGR